MKNKHPVLRRFMRRKVSVVAAAVLILFVLIAILGPLVWQVDPLKQSVMKKYGPMTAQHPLGTDNLGRDTLARMIYGARCKKEMPDLVTLEDGRKVRCFLYEGGVEG